MLEDFSLAPYPTRPLVLPLRLPVFGDLIYSVSRFTSHLCDTVVRQAPLGSVIAQRPLDKQDSRTKNKRWGRSRQYCLYYNYVLRFRPDSYLVHIHWISCICGLVRQSSACYNQAYIFVYAPPFYIYLLILLHTDF